MKLSELIQPRRVRCPLQGTSKEGALEELAGLAAEATPGLTRQDVLDMLHARERQGPYSMGRGVSFPHARMDRIKEMVIAVGSCPDGIDFQAPDGNLIRVVILFLVPRRHSNLYLHTLASFLHHFTNERNLERAARAGNAEAFISLIREFETQEDTGSQIEELIQPTPFLRVTQSVAHAIETILANQVERIPVIDHNEELCGEVTLSALLGIATPEHKEQPLRELGERIISRPTVVVSDTTPLTDLVTQLSRENTPIAYVVRNKRLIGQINSVELLRKMISR